jgi:hypothetical protein
MPHIPTRSPQYILLKGFFFFFFLITFVSFVSIRLGLRNGDQLLTLFFYIFFFSRPVQSEKKLCITGAEYGVLRYICQRSTVGFHFSSILLHIHFV